MLGIGVNQQRNRIVLDQHAYLETILDEAGYVDAKPRGTPWNAYQASKENELDTARTALYRRVAVQLMYLANGTRPDISYAVSRLTSNMKAPNEGDWERTKRVLKYLSRTRNMGIVYKRQPSAGHPLKLEAYADASFATDKIKGRSITGYIILCISTVLRYIGRAICKRLWRIHQMLQNT